MKIIIRERDIKFAKEKYKINLFSIKSIQTRTKGSMYTDPANFFVVGLFIFLCITHVEIVKLQTPPSDFRFNIHPS